MAELPTELYDLVARLDHAAAVYNWPDCTEAARKIEALRAENTRLRDEVSDLDALRARVAELEAVLHALRDAAETSDDARYGTLGTDFVRSVVDKALGLSGNKSGTRPE